MRTLSIKACMIPPNGFNPRNFMRVSTGTSWRTQRNTLCKP